MSVELITQSPEQSPKQPEFYRYIGLVALAHNRDTNADYLKQQIITELAESIDAELGTHGEPVMLRVRGERLIDDNGGDMTTSAVDWARQQVRRAEYNPNLAWFAQISLVEAKEHYDVVMFNDNAEIGNSMVVISPFPEDIYADPALKEMVAKEGFRPRTKRAFIRVYEKTTNGIAEHIQSIDTSDLQCWNELLAEQQIAAVDTPLDLLNGRHYYKNMSGKELIERLALSYDEMLYRKTGIYHQYGRSSVGPTESIAFVHNHAAIIRDTIKELSELPKNMSPHALDRHANNILYNSKALINNLYDRQLNGQTIVVNDQSARSMRGDAGQSAAASGKVYDGCSGQSSVITESVTNSGNSVTHQESFTIQKGKIVGQYEVVGIGSCPVCKTECIDGIRDKNSKKWVSCTIESCKAYDQLVIDKIYGVKDKSKQESRSWLDDALAFWGFRF